MQEKMPLSKIFYKIFSHIKDSLKYNYGINYILAMLLTFFIVISGLDFVWNGFCVSHLRIFYSGFTAAIIGMFVPVVVPLYLYISGRVKKNVVRQVLGLAVGQAAILGFSVSTFIKLFTGRIPPQFFASLADNSHRFQFGFYRGGWFNGWPSSHTTVAFAMAITLIQFFPNNRTVKIGAWIFALFIALGVSTNIHWLSDVVAGALIGYAIGKSVGLGFKKLVL